MVETKRFSVCAVGSDVAFFVALKTGWNLRGGWCTAEELVESISISSGPGKSCVQSSVHTEGNLVFVPVSKRVVFVEGTNVVLVSKQICGKVRVKVGFYTDEDVPGF